MKISYFIGGEKNYLKGRISVLTMAIEYSPLFRLLQQQQEDINLFTCQPENWYRPGTY